RRCVPGVAVGPRARGLLEAQAGAHPVIVRVRHGIVAPRAVFSRWQATRVISIFGRSYRRQPCLPTPGYLSELYARRWQIELGFRHIKTSMGMELLRCKSPQMVHKELEMFFIAHNLIRCLMAEAAANYDVPMERLSFKGTVDSVRQFSVA